MSRVQIPTQDTLKQIRRIQTITIAWMSIEAALSLWAAWTARSPALAAFGGDSAVELMCTVALSHACLRARGAACCAYRRRFAIRAGCMRGLGFGDVPVRLQRTKAQLFGDG